MDYNKRIGDDYLKADWQDGEIIQHTELNEIETVVKESINANYADIQKILDGTYNVGSAESISGTTLSKYEDEPLQNTDDKVPSSLQVKAYVDAAKQEAINAIPDDVSSFNNDAGYIDKNVNNLTYYTLATGTGSSIELAINSSTYEITLNLKNSAGTVISTGSVDLPLETMVVGATYDNTNKKIVLTLKNGTTLDVPVGDLVSGLQSEITSTNKLSADLVDDTNGTNKFVTAAEKTAWNNKQDIIQYTVMPTADVTTVGKIVQYIGETNNTYTNGYFYVGTNNGWENINVQDGGAAELEGFRNVDMAELGRIRTKYNKNNTVTPAMLYLEYGNAFIRFVFENNDYAHIDSGKLGDGIISNFDVTNGSIAIISDDGRLFQALTNQGFTNKTFICQFYSNDNSVVTVDTTYELVSSEIDNSSIAQNVNSFVKGDFNIQYSTMPTASANNLGSVVQYVGDTNSTYTNGYFYKCVSDEDEEEPTYSWENLQVQEGVSENVIKQLMTNAGVTEITDTNISLRYIYNNYGSGLFKFKNNTQLKYDYNDRYTVYAGAGSIMFIVPNGGNAILINKNDYGFNFYMFSLNTTTFSYGNSYYRGTIYGMPTFADASNYQKFCNVLFRLLNGSYLTENEALTKTNNTAYTPTSDYNPATKKYVDDTVAGAGGQTIQYDTMPTADATTVGQIVQYTGTTDSTYTNGYFYVGTTDGGDPATYGWENINVQDGGSSENYYITDNSAENPFIFSEHQLGRYYFNKSGPLYFKLNPEASVYTLSNYNYYYDTIVYSRDVSTLTTTGQIWATRRGFYPSGSGDAPSLFAPYDGFSYSPSRDDKTSLTTGSSKTYYPIYVYNDQTINGKKTFTVLPESSVVPTTNNQLVNKKYVDDQVGAINTVLATLTTPTSNGGE